MSFLASEKVYKKFKVTLKSLFHIMYYNIHTRKIYNRGNADGKYNVNMWVGVTYFNNS